MIKRSWSIAYITLVHSFLSWRNLDTKLFFTNFFNTALTAKLSWRPENKTWIPSPLSECSTFTRSTGSAIVLRSSLAYIGGEVVFDGNFAITGGALNILDGSRVSGGSSKAKPGPTRQCPEDSWTLSFCSIAICNDAVSYACLAFNTGEDLYYVYVWCLIPVKTCTACTYGV